MLPFSYQISLIRHTALKQKLTTVYALSIKQVAIAHSIIMENLCGGAQMNALKINLSTLKQTFFASFVMRN